MFETKPRLVPIGGFIVFHHGLICFIYLHLDRFYVVVQNFILTHQFERRVDRSVSKVAARILLDMGSRRKYGRRFGQLAGHGTKISPAWASELDANRMRLLKYRGICRHAVLSILPTFTRHAL